MKEFKLTPGRSTAVAIVATFAAFLWSQTGAADTFKHKKDGQSCNGYATHQTVNGKTVVFTQSGEKLELNLAQYEITPNALGRNAVFSVITVDDAIEYDMVTGAFEKLLADESDKGPLGVIIEIDSPGGRVDLAMRMCSAVTKTTNCPTIAFVKGGPHGGAYSAAAALTLACNKIYMAGGTAMGAATVIAHSDNNGIVDLEEAVGKNVSEKMRSAWRNYMASLAEVNHRSAALARAMENREIEVLQITRDRKTLFVESGEKMPGDQVIRIRNKRGNILTLPAHEAVECGMADKVVSGIEDILSDLNTSEAKIEFPDQMAKAKEELDKVIRKFKQLDNSLDTKFKTLRAKNKNGGLTIPEAKKSFKAIIQETKYLIKLKQNYPDVPFEEEELQAFLNSVQAEYDSF